MFRVSRSDKALFVVRRSTRPPTTTRPYGGPALSAGCREAGVVYTHPLSLLLPTKHSPAPRPHCLLSGLKERRRSAICGAHCSYRKTVCVTLTLCVCACIRVNGSVCVGVCVSMCVCVSRPSVRVTAGCAPFTR